MYTEDLGGKIKKWRVLDDESLSDHRYIIFEVDRTKEKEKQTEETRKWKITKEGLRTLPANIQITLWNRGKEEVRRSEDLESLIGDACDSTFQKSGAKRVRPRNKYWWSADIAQQRRKCIAIQRKITRKNTKLHRGRDKDNEEAVGDLMGNK